MDGDIRLARGVIDDDIDTFVMVLGSQAVDHALRLSSYPGLEMRTL